MSNDILEYSAAFKGYNDKFKEELNNVFNKWTKDSKVDLTENKKTVNQIHKTENEILELEKKLKNKKGLKGFLIFLIILSFIASIILGILTYLDFSSRWFFILIIAACLGVGIYLIILISTKIKNSIETFKQNKSEKEDIKNKLEKEAYKQLSPLFKLFDDELTTDLINKTVPLIKLDKNFSMKRYDILHNKYNLKDNLNENESTIGIISGEILGNPFIEEKRFVQTMKMATYTGSTIISYSEEYTDSEGHRQTRIRTETLTATVQRPAPVYSTYTRLIFANDVAPKLTFSRQAEHNHLLSEKDLNKKIKKGTKELNKKEKEALKASDDFTSMSNIEFEILFNALNRNNDAQFRLLFTPLAQKNMLHLLKTPEPFGDDFYFEKDHYLNYIISEHAQDWDLDVDSKKYIDVDYEMSKKKFLDFNEEYFTNLYFEFAPLLSIPLYQQHKSLEYIYKKTYDRNITSFESEVLANALNPDSLKHKDTATDLILKTKLISKNKNVDHISITAHSFKKIEKVTDVSVRGGDGKYHDVRVNYYEYNPLSKNTVATISEVTNNISTNKENEAFKHRIHITL